MNEYFQNRFRKVTLPPGPLWCDNIARIKKDLRPALLSTRTGDSVSSVKSRALCLVLDYEYLDDGYCSLLGDFEGLGELVDDILLLILEHTVGERDIYGAGK